MQKFEVGQRVQIISADEIKTKGKFDEIPNWYDFGDGVHFWAADFPFCDEFGMVLFVSEDGKFCDLVMENPNILKEKTFVNARFIRPAKQAGAEKFKRAKELRALADRLEFEAFSNSRFVATTADEAITKGRIYQMKDGILKDDLGADYIVIDTICDFAKIAGPQFVRIVEADEIEKIPF